MTVLQLASLFLTGITAGIAAGFLGIGGGAILTPLCLLIYPSLFSADENLIKIIFGTNMFLVMVFSFSAVVQHHSNNKIDWRTVMILAPLAILGSLTGAWLASVTNSSELKKAFAILLTAASLIIIIKGSTKLNRTQKSRETLLPLKMLPLLGFIAGFVGSFLGIGGGIIMVPTLILLFAYPIDRVAATSSSTIVFIGLTGVVSYMWHGWGETELPGWSTGYVWWSAAVPLMLGGIPMARVGAWLNAKTHDKILQRIFGCMLFLTGMKMLFFS